MVKRTLIYYITNVRGCQSDCAERNNHAVGVDEIRRRRYGIKAKPCIESSRSDVWNQSKGKYTLTRDNQAKRVGKLACQRASADCSASVPSKTEHSTKCRRANGGRARSMPYRRYATDYIHRTSRGDSIPILRIG